MSTLLLRFAAPLQSWGLDKFERRGTSRMPTKSAVIGMVMAAMGMKRDREIPNELKNLRLGVRGDDEGIVIRDFHIAWEQKPSKIEVKVKKLDNDNVNLTMKKPGPDTFSTYPFVTNRYYLCDAVFLVGLEGDEQLLKRIQRAFMNPVFPIYLGRKSCPPEGRVVLGIRNLSLQEALKKEPWLLQSWRQEQKQRENKEQNISLRLVVDAGVNDKGYLIDDMPISFDYKHRKYGARKVMDLPSKIIKNKYCRDHDAFVTAKGGG